METSFRTVSTWGQVSQVSPFPDLAPVLHALLGQGG
jgi:hypothetical protein